MKPNNLYAVGVSFKPEMVAAVKRDRDPKTQTRRTKGLDKINANPDEWEYSRFYDGYAKFTQKHNALNEKYIRCPYGQPGTIIWVRENHKMIGWDFEDGQVCIEYPDGEKIRQQCYDPTEDCEWLIKKIYELEKKGIIENDDKNEEVYRFTDKPQPFTPSLLMPQEYCRLFLEIVDIRVERLQDIGDKDAEREGIEYITSPSHRIRGWKEYVSEGKVGGTFYSPILSFKSLWILINGPESWDANPWVWVITFKIVGTPKIWPYRKNTLTH